MSQLEIHAASGSPDSLPIFSSHDPLRIREALAERGIGFERWTAGVELAPEAKEAEILEAYAPQIAQVRATGRYPTVDAIRMAPDHPDRATLRRKFLSEHTHSEDEVRFFVEGRGLFCLHIGEEVLRVLCETNDFLRVPAGTKHWFDMGEEPRFTAIRFFDNPEGWVAQFTGDPIAERFRPLDGAPLGKKPVQ
ncbi:MAG: 1,2-dihydroxy-3-keto-5-methylthiopentene dioxygenase [Cyanobacteriota bacterium]|jgi:1,2-dihydroxy-3-keto-5-methylthiopentene dioxygenase